MISIDPLTYVITVPRADLTLVSGTLYNHNTDTFRRELKDWEDSEQGITHPKTHNHSTSVEIVGVTYARGIIILPPYSIEYENGQYTVILDGSNNNIFDVANGILVQNQVQVIPSNSAGLQIVNVGSGVTEQDKVDIISGVWSNVERTLTSSGAITPQDIADIVNGVWSDSDRTLTESDPLTAQDIISIVNGVWEGSDRTLTESVTLTAQDLVDIVNGVWAGSDRTLTESITLTAQDLVDIVNGVWTGADRTLTESVTITETDVSDIVDGVWNEPIADHTTAGTYGKETMTKEVMEDISFGNWEIVNNQLIMYNKVGEVLSTFNLFNKFGDPTSTAVYKRELV